jgi:DNA polymerase-3 subunit delta
VKSKQTFKPIYVIVGKDEFLVSQHCHLLLDKLIEPSQRQTDLFDADPDETTITDVFDELRTMSFFSGRRVVLIKNADDFISDNREQLEKYFDNPFGPGILVLTVKTWKSNTNLAKKLVSVGDLVGAEEIAPWHLAEFVIDEAAKRGRFISKQNAQMLIELVGDEPGRLSSEVEKLSLFADTAKTISTAHIESLIGHNRLYNAFAVIDAIAASDPAAAIERLRNMFAGDREAEYTVVGAFAWHFRRLFTAKVSLEKGSSPAQAAARLGIKPMSPRYQPFVKQLSMFSLVQIGSFLQELAQVDYFIKTGRATAPIAMEQLVLRLASVRV